MRTALLKAGIVLLPSYLAAWLTGQMVWVVSTLVAATFFAATVDLSRRVDETHEQEVGKDVGKEHGKTEIPDGLDG